MSVPLEKVEADALELPVHERAELAHRLLVSLDEEEHDDPAEVEREWHEEIRRRVADLESGATEFVPAQEVFARIRARPR